MLHYFIVLNTMKSHLLECVEMQNYKIEVQNHSESIEAQELFFNLGYSWFHKKFEAIEIKTPETIMCFENGALTTGIRGSAKHKQITMQELRAMVIPKQKEYLVKTDTGYTLQVLSDVVDGHDGIIDVPDGANAYIMYRYEKKADFLKIGTQSSVFIGNCWEPVNPAYTKIKDFIDDGDIVLWQRESLNDQVASAEQARQEQKQCKCSTVEIQESGLIFGVQGIMAESIPVGLIHHGFTQPEELPFVGGDTKFATEYQAVFFRKDDELDGDLCIEYVDNAWNKQIGGDHYKKLAIQPMEYALQNKLDYAQANVVKYVTRHADKGGKDDLLKAIHNIELMIAHYYSDQE